MEAARERLDEAVRRAIDRYNAYRAPEARAELVSLSGRKLVVRISGSFTETCGVNDWIEDLVYTLEDEGVKARIVKIIEPENPLDLGWERTVILEVEA
ncbi:MAG: hypothetical protein GSR80_001593 [Desulfurococcales archaeon]|nr:hypothetical protein [Desulfurococcales archaeon]